AFDAMRNFQYDSLTVDLNGDLGGRMYVNLLAKGRNPDMMEGRPIEFALNTTAEFARLIQRGMESLDLGATLREAQENPPPGEEAETHDEGASPPSQEGRDAPGGGPD
ncbi:MAG: YdbH domain-containing protein, partial [Caulobacterales bacterium]|nr:YdbH domain-containing protein [Caulobacterales bacterium]